MRNASHPAHNSTGLGLWVTLGGRIEPGESVLQAAGRELTETGHEALVQIRPIVDSDNPDRLAIDDRDQCVAFFGVDSRVATSTSST